MCDNCKTPKPTIEGQKFVTQLLNVIIECKQRFKPKEIAKILIGESNSLIKQHMSQIDQVFGIGKEKSIQFWHSIIRQIYVKQLITKEIESYGILKITKLGEEFLQKPYSIKITEDHDYNKISNQKIISNQKGQALDNNLYHILKDLRKQQAKSIGLPPSIIFMEPSLIDMANQYPITFEELAQMDSLLAKDGVHHCVPGLLSLLVYWPRWSADWKRPAPTPWPFEHQILWRLDPS